MVIAYINLWQVFLRYLHVVEPQLGNSNLNWMNEYKTTCKNKQIMLDVNLLHIFLTTKTVMIEKNMWTDLPNLKKLQFPGHQVIHQSYQPRLYQRLPTKGINPRSWTTSSWFAPRPWMWGFLFGTKPGRCCARASEPCERDVWCHALFQ